MVLIILDERHDNYVLFTVSPTLYFLHSESLAALDLKPGECGKCQTTSHYYLLQKTFVTLKSFGVRNIFVVNEKRGI